MDTMNRRRYYHDTPQLTSLEAASFDAVIGKVDLRHCSKSAVRRAENRETGNRLCQDSSNIQPESCLLHSE